MRAATAATRNGHGEAFARAAFRAAFTAGSDLAISGHIAAAAAVSGLDPEALLADAVGGEVKRALREATEEAATRGIHGVPTVLVAGTPFFGDDQLEAAATALE